MSEVHYDLEGLTYFQPENADKIDIAIATGIFFEAVSTKYPGIDFENADDLLMRAGGEECPEEGYNIEDFRLIKAELVKAKMLMLGGIDYYA